MAKYITLLDYTTEGVAHIGELGDRLAAARAAAADMGITIESFYLTLGHYDAVVIAEAPDRATLASFLLKLGGMGRFSTETLGAFTEEEALAIAANV